MIALALVMAMSLIAYASEWGDPSEAMTELPTESPTPSEGSAGKLTISGTKDGEEVWIYRLFDATVDGSGHVAYELNTVFEDYLKEVEGVKNSEGTTTSEKAYAYLNGIRESNGDLVKFSENLFKEIKKNEDTYNDTSKNTRTVATGAADTTVFENLPFGYYLVNPVGATALTTGASTSVMLVSVLDNTANLVLKSTYPTVDQTIGESEKAKDYAIGEMVTFQLKSTVPDMTGYTAYSFVFKDTLSAGLSFDDITSVKIGTQEIKDITKDNDGTHTYALERKEETDTTDKATFALSFNNFIGYTSG